MLFMSKRGQEAHAGLILLGEDDREDKPDGSKSSHDVHT